MSTGYAVVLPGAADTIAILQDLGFQQSRHHFFRMS